jgi:hypothetical protein
MTNVETLWHSRRWSATPLKFKRRRPSVLTVAAALLGTVSVLTACDAHYAHAADLPVKSAPVAAPVPYFTWTGFYVGAIGGYSWSGQGVNFAGTDAAGQSLINNNVVPGNLPVNPRGWALGVEAGYNFQLGRTLFGVEADESWTDINGTASAIGNWGIYTPSSYTPSSFVHGTYTSSSPTVIDFGTEVTKNGVNTWNVLSITTAPSSQSTTAPTGWNATGQSVQVTGPHTVVAFYNGVYSTYTLPTATTSTTIQPSWWSTTCKPNCATQVAIQSYSPSSFVPGVYNPSSYSPSSFVPGTFATSHTQSVSELGTFRARAGFLPYNDLVIGVSGGLAWGSYSAAAAISGAGAFQGLGWAGSASGFGIGYAAGPFAEYAFGNSGWSAKAEVIYYNLGTKTVNLTPVNALSAGISGGHSASFTIDGWESRVGLNYKF